MDGWEINFKEMYQKERRPRGLVARQAQQHHNTNKTINIHVLCQEQG